jgi:DNA-binding beta-propeller fold protein YncE
MKRLAIFPLLLAFTLPVAAQTPIRMRCGASTSYTDSKGNVWAADSGSSGGSVYTTTHAIAGTPDQSLFQIERWSSPHLTYAFKNLPNGTYHVNILLAEIYWSAAGQRVMSISMQGTTVFPSVDIVKDVGQFAPDTKSADESVTNGTLTIDMTATVNNPKCSAIEIIPATAPTSISLSGTLKWDDATAIQGTVQVQQLQSNVWQILGNFTPDAQGHVSGVVTIATDFQSPTSFNFILMDGTGKALALVEEVVPGQMFQIVRSISGFSLVVAKASCTVACTLAPGSTFGTLGL